MTHQLLDNVYSLRISAIGSLITRGIEDFYLFEGNVNWDISSVILYRDACSVSCCPLMVTVRGRYVLVMDNTAIHHMEAVIDLLTAAGILKAYIKDNEIAYQSTRNPRLLVSSALASITSDSHA